MQYWFASKEVENIPVFGPICYHLKINANINEQVSLDHALSFHAFILKLEYVDALYSWALFSSPYISYRYPFAIVKCQNWTNWLHEIELR